MLAPMLKGGKMKRRNNEGSVFYNKTRNRWNAQYKVKENGKIKLKTKSFKSKKDAEDFIDIIMYERDTTNYLKNHKINLTAFMKSRALAKLNSNTIREAQYTRICSTIRNIEKSEISKMSVKKIKDTDIQKFLNTLIKDYSNSTITKIYGEFNQVFDYLYHSGFIKVNPMFGVIKPKSVKESTRRRAMTLDEEKLFVQYLKSTTINECKYKNIYLIQLFMGLRIGEVLALTINDIDFLNNIIKINKSLTVDGNGKIICGNKTKTDAGYRDVPIHSKIIKELKEQIKFAKGNKLNLLFPNNNNGYTDERKVNIKLTSILSNLGITGISTHSLRYTFATRCAESGISDIVLKEIMGHYDIEITKNVYIDVQETLEQEEIKKVEKYLRKVGIVK